ncbi:MAG: OadG family protein [Peptococcaceae bacterium]
MFGLKVTLLGMGTVFVSLCVIMLLIQLQSKILSPQPKEKAESIAPIPQPVQTVPVKEDDSDEIAAVIAAAIAACESKVVIRNIKRVPGNAGSVWASASRAEAMQNF